MRDIAAVVASAAISTFAITSMLSVGLGTHPREVIRPLRHPPALIRAVVANFILVPALAWLVAKALQLEEPLQTGLVLAGVAAGAPFLIKLSETAAARLDLTAALLVLLLPLTVLYMPLVLPLLLPQAHVPAMAIAVPLVLTMLLPLAVGLLARAQWPTVAGSLRPILAKLSTLALVILMLSTLLANYNGIIEIGARGVLAAVIVVLGAFVIGYTLGSSRHRREILGLATAQRNISAATIVASQSFDEPEALVMVIATSLIGLAVLFPVAHVLRRRKLE
jgi:BASS family bile acid:Na+ symporter